MPNIKSLQLQQAVIRSEMEQLKPELWSTLFNRGELWTDRLDQMINAFANHDEDPWNTVGALAQLGFLCLLSEYTPPD